MFACILISVLLLLGILAIAYSVYFLIHTKRIQNDEDRKGFRSAVVHRLQKHGTKGFDFPNIVAEYEVPHSLASEVAEEILRWTPLFGQKKAIP